MSVVVTRLLVRMSRINIPPCAVKVNLVPIYFRMRLAASPSPLVTRLTFHYADCQLIINSLLHVRVTHYFSNGYRMVNRVSPTLMTVSHCGLRCTLGRALCWNHFETKGCLSLESFASLKVETVSFLSFCANTFANLKKFESIV